MVEIALLPKMRRLWEQCTQCTSDNKKVFFTSPRWGKSNKSYYERSTLWKGVSLNHTPWHACELESNFVPIPSYISSGHSLLLSLPSSHFIHLYPPSPFYSLVFPFSPSSHLFHVLATLTLLANVLYVGVLHLQQEQISPRLSFRYCMCKLPSLLTQTQNGQSMKRLFRSHQRQRGWDRERVQPEDRREIRKTIDSSVGQKWVEGKTKIECPILIKLSFFYSRKVSLHKTRYDLLLLIKTSVDEK